MSERVRIGAILTVVLAVIAMLLVPAGAHAAPGESDGQVAVEGESSADAGTGSGEDGVSNADADADAGEGEAPTAPEEAPAAPQQLDAIGPQAAGDPPTFAGFSVNLVSTGTPDFDAAAGPGNDTSASDDIVRVNDTVRYRVNYRVEGETGTNTRVRITFPKGIEVAVPPQCGAGSTVTPATATAGLTLPLHENSRDELAEQTLDCNLGTIEPSGSEFFDFDAKVLNLVHDEQQLTLVSASIEADESVAPTTATDLPTVQASSRLMWDISKNGIAADENTGYMYGPANSACPWDQTRVCKRSIYSVLMSAPAGGKGAMPAIGDITFTDDLSPRALYPGLTEAQYAAMEADPDKYGARAIGAGTTYARPGSKIGGTENSIPRTEQNSVRDTGQVTYVQNGPGEPVTFTIRNADTTLKTYPINALHGATNPTAIPGNTAYAISASFDVYVPADTVRDFGVGAGATKTLFTRNAYSDLSVNGFGGAHQDSDGQPGPDATKTDPQGNELYDGNWNDYRTSQPVVSVSGSMSKWFSGVPGAPGNMSASEFSPSDTTNGVGPAGGATIRSGGITVAPRQDVISSLYVVGAGIDSKTDDGRNKITHLVCDTWDNTKLHLRAASIPGAPGANTSAGFQKVPSDGKPVWVAGYNNVLDGGTSRFATAQSETPELIVQYSAVGGGTGDQACGDNKGPWVNDPALVSGNDPALAAEGIYTGVARVRAHIVLPEPEVLTGPVGSYGTRALIAVSMRVADDAGPTGTIVPNWASELVANSDDPTMQQMLASMTWPNHSYDPDTHVGQPGDRLIVAEAQVRVEKTVRKGSSGNFSKTPPSTTGDDLVQYRLKPSLTSGAMTPGVLKDVWVEDCLPGSQVYNNASLLPAVVSATTPADAKRPACAAGETYIRWVIQDHEVNQVIEPIILTVDVDSTAEDGVYDNTVVVWAEDDASTLAQRRDNAQVQIGNRAGVKLQKFTQTPLVQVNRAGQAVNEEMKWTVRLTNMIPTTAGMPVLSDPDIIDVLPKNGEGATDFTNDLEFVSASVTSGGPNTRILYTGAATVHHDPSDASNGAGGIAWCDAPGGAPVIGAGACPATAADVTGLRIQRPGQEYLNGDVLAIELTMVGLGNRGGDVYQNHVFADVEGLEFPVGPIRRNVEVIESSIGDYVWWDLNRDGLQNEFDGSPEPPAPGVRVTLTGKDDLGNDVSLSDTTDADGLYGFETLRSAGPEGYVVTFEKPDGSSFTTKHAGDATIDSDADPATGQSDPIMLGRNIADPTIDAGLVSDGGLQIGKLLRGAGVAPFSGGDEFEFEVVCTLGDAEVYNDTVELTAENGVVPDSDVISVPAQAVCVITETSAGNADDLAPPVTVTIPAAGAPEQVVKASVTNWYSAGTVELEKTLDGAMQDDAFLNGLSYDVLLTCEVGEGANAATVHSATYELKPDEPQTAQSAGETLLLPVGAKCWGEETDANGAASSSLSHDSRDNALVVTKQGETDELQKLELSVTNTFDEAELTVSKTVAGYDSGDGFEFELSCTYPVDGQDVEYPLAAGDASFTLKHGESKTVKVPAGASCTATESGVAQDVTVTMVDSDGTNDGSIADLSGTDNTIDITNDVPFPATEFEISKVVVGGAASYAPESFPIEVSCVFDGQPVAGYPQTVDVKGGESVTLTAPLTSRCTAEELNDGGATNVAIDPVDGITLDEPGEKFELTVTNTFDAGAFKILKQVEGSGASLTKGEYTFEVACTFNGSADPVFTDTVTLTGTGASLESEEIGGLPVGAECVITETANGGADETPDPVQIVIDDDPETVQIAGFVNEFSAGTVEVSKVLDGAAAEEPFLIGLNYEVEVTCQVEVEGKRVDTFGGRVDVKAGETVAVERNGEPVLVPLGSRCWGDETGTQGASSASVDHDGWDNAVVVEKGTSDEPQVIALTATNTFDRASLKVSKKVEGSAPNGADYSFELACTYPVTGPDGAIAHTPYALAGGDARFTLKAGESRTVTVLAGVTCTATEVDVPKGAKVTIVDSDDTTTGGTSDGKLSDLRGDGNTVEVTNTFTKMAVTGAAPLTAGLIAAGVLLLAGAVLLVVRRRRRHAAGLTEGGDV